MGLIRIVAIVVGCLVLVVGMTAGASTGVGPSVAATDDEQVDGADAEADGPLGSKISSFMQASAAELDGSVESGMWSASAESPDDVDRRARGLERRLERIEQQQAALDERLSEGDIGSLEYQSRSSRLLGQYLAIEAALSDASSVAQGNQAAEAALDRVRERSERTGPAVAGAARGMPSEPPGLADRDRSPGPPADPPGRNGPDSDDDDDSTDAERPGGGPPDDRGGAPDRGGSS